MTALAIDDCAFRNPQLVIPGPERSEGARNLYSRTCIRIRRPVAMDSGLAAAPRPGMRPCSGERLVDLDHIDADYLHTCPVRPSFETHASLRSHAPQDEAA